MLSFLCLLTGKKKNPAEDSEALKMVKPCDGRDFGPEGGHGLESTHPVL